MRSAAAWSAGFAAAGIGGSDELSARLSVVFNEVAVNINPGAAAMIISVLAQGRRTSWRRMEMVLLRLLPEATWPCGFPYLRQQGIAESTRLLFLTNGQQAVQGGGEG